MCQKTMFAGVLLRTRSGRLDFVRVNTSSKGLSLKFLEWLFEQQVSCSVEVMQYDTNHRVDTNLVNSENWINLKWGCLRALFSIFPLRNFHLVCFRVVRWHGSMTTKPYSACSDNVLLCEQRAFASTGLVNSTSRNETKQIFEKAPKKYLILNLSTW